MSGSETISASGAPARFRFDVTVAVGIAIAVMGVLTRVFFEVEACDADSLFRAIFEFDIDPAIFGKWFVELRDLVALREIGIEVILPSEDRLAVDAAVDRDRSADALRDRLAIEHWQCTGKSEDDGVSLGVCVVAELVRARREDLGVGLQLNMDFESNDGLILRDRFRVGED